MSSTDTPSVATLRLRAGEAIEVFRSIEQDETLALSFSAAVAATVEALRHGGRILLCGNGGSSADAQHFAAELVGRFMLNREAWSAICLSDNMAAVTAVGNDYNYEDVFVRAVQAHGRKGDVLLGLSTSGNSRNVITAFETARELGITTIALVGPDLSPMSEIAEIALHIDGPNTARIQEGHKLVGHTLFELVEQELVSRASQA